MCVCVCVCVCRVCVCDVVCIIQGCPVYFVQHHCKLTILTPFITNNIILSSLFKCTYQIQASQGNAVLVVYKQANSPVPNFLN